MGGCLAPAWQTWQSWGAEAWVVTVLKEGYRVPFKSQPPLSPVPIFLPSYSPTSPRGIALAQEHKALLEKGAIEPAPSSPGYYSRVFVAMKASGAWRPIIDLSALNLHVDFTKFHMETPQSVLRSVRKGDWMVSIDLKDAYLQVPVHPDSRRFLRFVSGGQAFQFKVLPFGLTTAPQVFTRVMAPVSAIMHRLGFRILRYLDDWLILGSSLEEVIRARDFLLHLCDIFLIRVNLEKSSLIPSQDSTYLGMRINSLISRVFPTQGRLQKLASLLEEFLSSHSPSALLWMSLLGTMSSLTLLIPGARLRMRSLQIILRKSWDFHHEAQKITYGTSCLGDLQWWSDASNLTPGVPLEVPHPDIHLYTDASDQGWGATLQSMEVSGIWSPPQSSLSINHRELIAVGLALQYFLPFVEGRTVAIFTDNTTAISYLKKFGGTRSATLNTVAQGIIRFCERNSILLMPQFVPGKLNVKADALSRQNQILGAEWTLCQEVVDQLIHKWPCIVDLFATNQSHRLPTYFSPVPDPAAVGVDAMLHSWDGLQAYAFPPFALIQQVLVKLRQSRNTTLTLIAPFWPQRPWFPDLLDLLVEVPVQLPFRKDLLRQPHFHRLHRNLHVLQLYAWRLSSEALGVPDSLRLWLDSLQDAGVNPQ